MKKRGVLFLCILLVLIPSFLFANGDAENGSGKEQVKIGFIGPITGGNAAVGIGAKNSFELRVNQILADGSYPYDIEVIYEDDASDPSTGVSAANKLCSDPELVAAATHWNSPVGLATVHVFNRYSVAQVFWGTIHSDIIYGNDYKGATRLIPTSVQNNEYAADFAINKFELTDWVIINDTTDYGTKNRDEFTAAVEKEGGKILKTFGISVGQQDFQAILSQVRELNPQGIYYAGVVTEAAGIKKQMIRLGLDDVMFMGPPGIQSDTFGEITQQDGNGSFCSGSFDVYTTYEGMNFVDAYYAAYSEKEPFEQNGPFAYDAADIILKALAEVGPDREAIINWIASNDHAGLVGNIIFDDHGQNILGGIAMYVQEDSHWVNWESSSFAAGKKALPWE